MTASLKAPKKTARRSRPFWKTKDMAAMTRKEWELLCDGCGRCCLHKLEDTETKKIEFTDVSCKLLDCTNGRCSDYKNRQKKVPDCINLTAELLPEMNCLPPTCAYVLIYKGKDLYWWHHLISGRRATVHEAGISVVGKIESEAGLTARQIARRVVSWPKSRRAKSPAVSKKTTQSSARRKV